MEAQHENSRQTGDGVPVEGFFHSLQSIDVEKAHYVSRVTKVARWSDWYGCKGILVYTNNLMVDSGIVI